MKNLKYDLHIHSALSPCADILLSPNNILNMAYLSELDLVAITDHNSLKQSIGAYELASGYDFLYILGVEISTSEGVHVLCYFKNINEAIKFDLILETLYQEFNTTQEQVLFDEHDNFLKNYPYDLYQEIISLNQLFKLLKDFDSLVILAHIDRYSLFVLEKIKIYLKYFDAIEIKNIRILNEYQNIKEIENKKFISNSDSHFITDIGFNNQSINLQQLDIDVLFNFFKGKNNE